MPLACTAQLGVRRAEMALGESVGVVGLGMLDGAAAGVGVECVGLPPRAVEREHELPAKPLAERMLGGETLELRERRVVPAEEMVMKILRYGMRVVNAPTHEYKRRFGESHIRIWREWPRFVWCVIEPYSMSSWMNWKPGRPTRSYD